MIFPSNAVVRVDGLLCETRVVVAAHWLLCLVVCSEIWIVLPESVE
jgi:hypothetical protein